MPAVVAPSGQQASPGERHRHLGGEGHLFVVACYFCDGGLTRPTVILDRQRRDPTKGRIRNTPFCAPRASAKGKVASGKRVETTGRDLREG